MARVSDSILAAARTLEAAPMVAAPASKPKAQAFKAASKQPASPEVVLPEPELSADELAFTKTLGPDEMAYMSLAKSKGLGASATIKMMQQMKNSTAQTDTTQRVNKQTSGPIFAPEQLPAAIQAVKDNPTPGEQGASDVNQQLMQTIDQYKTSIRPQLDLNQLAGAIDGIFGTKNAANIPKPASMQSQKLDLAKMQNALGDNFAQQAQRENQMLQAMKIPPGTITDTLGQQLKKAQEAAMTVAPQITINNPPPKPGPGEGALDKARERFANKMEQYKVPQLSEALHQVNQLVPGGLTNWTDDKKLPGYDASDKAYHALTFGTDVGMNQTSKDLRAASQSVVNILTNYRSGATVTDNEAQRLGEELGNTMFKTPHDMVAGLRKANAFLQKTHQNLKAGAGREVVRSYEKEGGSIYSPDTQAPMSNNMGPAPINGKDLLDQIRAIKDN